MISCRRIEMRDCRSMATRGAGANRDRRRRTGFEIGRSRIRRLVACVASGGILLFGSYALGDGGDLLWQDLVNVADGQDEANALAVKGRAVFVAGNFDDAVSPASGFDWVVRAYDIKTGDVLWEDLFDVAEGTDSAYSLAVSGRRSSSRGHLSMR